jgi:hypothetical protein
MKVSDCMVPGSDLKNGCYGRRKARQIRQPGFEGAVEHSPVAVRVANADSAAGSRIFGLRGNIFVGAPLSLFDGFWPHDARAQNLRTTNAQLLPRSIEPNRRPPVT